MFGFSIRRRLCSASAIIAGAAVLFAGLPAVADTSQAATANVDSTSVAPAVDVQAANLSSSAPTAAAAATKPLTCVPGVVYSVLSTGQVRQLAAASGTNVKAVDAPGGLSSFNGLGIGANGEVAYGYERGSKSSNIRDMYRYDASTGQWAKVANSANPNAGSLIAGAVDLNTGKYFYGGFGTKTERVWEGWTWVNRTYFVFNLYRYDPVTNVHTSIGYVRVDDRVRMDDRVAANGDIAFDSQGNLYILGSSGVSNGQVNLQIVSVTKATLQAAVASPNASSELTRNPNAVQTISATSGFNGLAFDATGSAYVGNSTTVFEYNASTWQQIGTKATGLSSSTDLASCTSPPTLTVQKNMVGRAAASDQFTLTAAQASTTVATTTTAGDATGVQPQQIGPTPVQAGQNYTISEAIAAGSASTLADYTSKLACTADGQPLTVTPNTGITGEITVPAFQSGTKSPDILCTFTNTPLPATQLQLVKAFDVQYGGPQNASAWALHATQSGSALDFTSGEVKTVAPGSFTIGETAQLGFKLTQVVCTANGASVPVSADGVVDVAAHALTVCALTNADQPGALTWQKVDSVTGELLGGSVWTLTGPGGYSQQVADNEGQDGYAGLDTDPSSGGFRVEGLAWGQYSLSELTAPDGYAPVPGVAATFTISAGALQPATVVIGNDYVLRFHLQKLGYAQTGQSDPALIDGSSFVVRADDTGQPGAVIDSAVDPTGTGTFDLLGLTPGTYWLEETQAPEGHNLLAQAVKFTVVQDAEHPKGAVAVDDASGLVMVSDDALTITVSDTRAVTLPISGGIGTLPYALGGFALLLLAALGWGIVSRRAHHRR